MRNSRIAQWTLILLVLGVALVACRRSTPETPSPAAEPTAVGEAQTGDETTVEPTAVPTEPPTAEPVPQPTATPVRTSALSPDEIDWPPQMLYSEPAAGQEMPVAASITMRFDQPMDADSVEAAWSLDPAVEGTFDWPRPDTVVFTPSDELKRETAYRLQVADTAASQNGFNLAPALDLTLQTVGFLSVTETIPADATSGVETDAAITVVFNRPVVPLVSSDQQGDLPQPLTLDPATAGTGEWLTTAVYRFVPDGPLAGATTYTATVAAGLEDLTGGVLAEDVTWRFTTLAPSVNSIFPPNGATNVLPTSPITITFSMPMDRAATETAVSLQGGTTPAALGFEWQDDDRTLVATPEQQLDMETVYDIVVAQSARAANGAATLDRETTATFESLPFPAVIDTWPRQASTSDPWTSGVNFTFAGPMDPDTLEGRIIIEPAPDKEPGFNYNEWTDLENPSNSSASLWLDFQYERDTEYTVTIPADAADRYGNTLGEPFVLRFRSADLSDIASLNLPDRQSQLSTSFPTNVEVIHRNVEEFTIELYDVGVPAALLADAWSVYDYNPDVEPVTFRIPADSARDEIAVTPVELADGGELPTGVYFLKVSAPGISEEARYWQNQRNLVVVADTNLVIKEMPTEVRVWATNLESGQPAAGLNLTFYNARGAEIGTAETDNSGFASLDYRSPEGYLEGVSVVSEAPGADGFGAASSRWSGGVDPWRLGINVGWSWPADEMVYMYTDRPIYRPGDTMYFKGILRQNDFARYPLPPERTVDLVITSNFYVEDGPGLEERIPVTIDSEGLFYGEFVIPEGAMLGSYVMRLDSPDITGDRTFTVAEYRRPEYQVVLTPQQDEALRGESVDVELEATYFFGGTADSLPVNYTVYEELFYPAVEGVAYSFSDQASFNYESTGPFGPSFGGVYGNYLLGENGVTDANGRLTITLPPDLLDEVDEGSRRVTVEAFVQDISNFPVTSTAAVVFHAADAYVGVRPTDYAPPVGIETSVDLLTVDWDGAPLGEQAVEVVFYQRNWESERAQGFAGYYTEWTPVDTEVARTAVTTDENGEAVAGFVPEDPGSYIAVATVTDASGRTQFSSTYLWVIDEDFAGWRTDERLRSMDIVPERKDYRVGETARILVQSPFSVPTEAWLFIERGKMVEQRVITLNGGSELVDVPITADHAPNIFVTIAAVKPVTRDDEANPYADIRVGITELRVAPDQFALNIDLTPRAEQFAPGDTAVYDILVTDSGGNPVEADLSLALVDLAVLSLLEDNAPPIMEAFYSPVPYYSQLGSGLLISGEGLEPEVPLEALGGGGGGGDGLAEEAVGRLEEEDETRRNFPDTAYWNPSVKTGADGTAVVEIPLPDTLTTWRLSSKAVTTDTRVGQDYVDIISSLPLLLRPITPRFFTVGDALQIGTVINNNTGEPIEATATLEAEGFDEAGFEPQTVTVPANSQEVVRWTVTVADVPFVNLTFRVTGGEYSDATKPSFGVGPDNQIPVYRYDAPDITGTANELLVAGQSVEAVLLPPNVDERRGSVDVTLSPSLAAALIDALNIVEETDYDVSCAHAITDRLLPNMATEIVLQNLDLDPGLEASLREQNTSDIPRLESLQRGDGGWAYCRSTRTDPWLSAYALLALAKAQEAGYDVNAQVYDNAVRYVERQLKDVDRLTNTDQVNRQAFFLYVLAEAGTSVDVDADELVDAHRGLLDSYAKGLLVTAYEINGATGGNQQALLSDLNAEAAVSATSAHWEDMQPDFFNLSSDVRGTAMVIDALTRSDPENTLLDAAVRWLMVARTAEIWRTPHETAWAIFALGNFLTTTGELDADFPYQLNVNATPLAEGTFMAENITRSEAISVPINALVLDETNYFDFRRGEGPGKLYYTMHLNSYVPAESVTATSRPLTVSRQYFDAACDPETETCEPIDGITAGQQVRVVLTLVAPNDLVYAVMEDPYPSGAEGIDPNLNITQANLGGGVTPQDLDPRFGFWGWWHFESIEYRDEKVVFTSSFLPAGTYQYTYYLQTSIPGDYQVMPALAYQEFFPETFGRSEGKLFSITE